MILVFDCHENPGELSAQTRKAIALAKEWNDSITFGGDTWNFQPYGTDAYVDSPAVNTFIELLNGHDATLLEGNHDLLHQLIAVFGAYPNIKIQRDLTIGNVYVTHGHTWGPLWIWLSWFADDIVRVAMAVCPGTWYRFSRWAGWMPSQVKSEKRYHAVVRSLLNRALIHHDKTGHYVAMGHGHHHYSVWDQGTIVVASLPPLVDGIYCHTYGTSLSFAYL